METARVNNTSHPGGWLFFLLLLISGQGIAQQYDENAVKDAFDGLKKAIYGKQGKWAASLVDQRTLAYYDRAFEEATSFDSVRLTARPLYERLLALSIRIKGRKDGTAGMKAKPFFTYAADSGLFQTLGISLGLITPGEITFRKDSASAPLFQNEMPMPHAVLRWHYEANSWKVDLTSLFAWYDRVNAGSKEAENDYAMDVLAITCKWPRGRSIWKPLVVQ